MRTSPLRLTARPPTFAVALLILALASGSLAGCVRSGGQGNVATNAKGCTKIGVLLPESDTSARWEGKDHPALVAAISKALPGAHIDITNANKSVDNQRNQADADLTKGDCILIVAPVNSEQAATIVDIAKQRGVPVIAYDRLIQSPDLAYYVSFDNVRVGELQGQYIADHHTQYSKDGHTYVAMINGAPTDNNAKLFKQGAHNRLDPLFNAGKMHNVYEQDTPNWDNPTARNEMDAALTRQNNDVQVAYVANDGMALTVIQSLSAHGLAGRVLVTGQDATPDGVRNILLGTQMMTVYKAVQKEAEATAQLVAALNRGDTNPTIINANTQTSIGVPIPSVLETPVIVTKENIADTVLKDGFVSKDEICRGVPAGTAGVC